MPPAVAAAAVTAAGGLGGAALASRSNSQALKAQERAARQAISYQEEKDWQARADARYQWENYMRSMYPDKFPGPTAATTPAAAGATPVGPVTIANGAPTRIPTPVALPEVPSLPVTELPASPAVPALVPQNGARSLADVGPWSASNFSNYIGRR